jgi:predicted TIM-barrel fold metal-dependent hydrolase
MDLTSGLMDLDSHEMVPLKLWDSVFDGAGRVVEPIMGPDTAIRAFLDFPIDVDDAPIDQETIWTVKGSEAPGSFDLHRRLLVMDAMGVERQLMYPNMGHLGSILATAPIEDMVFLLGTSFPASFDYRAAGREMVRLYNDWVIRSMKDIPEGRIRPLGVLLLDDLDDAFAEAGRILEWARGIVVPTTNPPGGVSPADRSLDPLWRMLVEANAPITVHLGADWGFMRRTEWGRIPEFARSTDSPYASAEFPGPDPYWGATMHLGNENWLTAMVLGGVFERHPDLRFGVIENGAIWLGPLAERLDTWAEQFAVTAARTMSMKPSEYLARNVRVSPLYFERIDMYFERWPHLHDVYSFATDYPHPEGGKHTARRFEEMLTPLGDDVLQKFFKENGKLLLPDG